MKRIFLYLLLLYVFGVMAQTPQTDPHWLMNNTFSDEFNGSKRNIWGDLNGNSYWCSSIFRPQNIQFGTEGNRNFIRFVAEIINDVIYSGGIETLGLS